MQDWQERVVEERDALKIKFDRLVQFIEEGMKGAEGYDRNLLDQQRAHMRAYLNILDARIERFR